MINDADRVNVNTSTANSYVISKLVFLSNVTCSVNKHYSSSSSSTGGNGAMSVNANTAAVKNTFGIYGMCNDRPDINEQIFVLCKNGHVHQLCLTK